MVTAFLPKYIISPVLNVNKFNKYIHDIHITNNLHRHYAYSIPYPFLFKHINTYPLCIHRKTK